MLLASFLNTNCNQLLTSRSALTKNELIEFKREHGHCNVPQNYPANRQLGHWVNTQRMTLKKYIADETLPLDDKVKAERLRKLQDIGFDWGYELVEWDQRYVSCFILLVLTNCNQLLT